MIPARAQRQLLVAAGRGVQRQFTLPPPLAALLDELASRHTKGAVGSKGRW